MNPPNVNAPFVAAFAILGLVLAVLITANVCPPR